MKSLFDRIPHRPPWLLVDRVVEAGGDRVLAERRVSADDPLARDGLPELLTVEALAQAAACLNAGEMGAHRGYLVAATGFSFEGRVQPGETLLLEATRTAALGGLHRFEGVARAVNFGGEARIVARGQMTFAVEKIA
jgi:3-hydroxymyristoyl/3-hydroxydecanoyl-(acyl carrier protein) dehydratase